MIHSLGKCQFYVCRSQWKRVFKKNVITQLRIFDSLNLAKQLPRDHNNEFENKRKYEIMKIMKFDMKPKIKIKFD